MKQKELLVPIYLKNGRAVAGLTDKTVFGSGDAAELAVAYSNAGADAILLFDLSQGDKEHDQSIGMIKEIARRVDIPIYGGGNIRRVEDVKKLIYAGCRKVFLNYSKASNVELTREVSERFGREKMLSCAACQEELQAAVCHREFLGGAILLDGLQMEDALLVCAGAGIVSGEETAPKGLSHLYCFQQGNGCEGAASLLGMEAVSGIISRELMDPAYPVMELKHQLLAKGIPVNTYESSLSWEDVKRNSDGLLPVVVQDYKTLEVLMVAYMNREAFELTVRSGRMTYWSRSRRELWIKGMTSGHFQYVKELRIDCDNDTLLAKVAQVGAACHTGNRSCFYRSILKKEYDETNPLKVFEDVFDVIQDRKVHPKEGSYTNYLFDKGIDKILKKVGEEATEIVIAAKNPDPEEIKYEISDFLYHVMVLMAERGVTWEDITEELARR